HVFLRSTRVKRAEDLLHIFNLEEKRHSKTRALSKGLKQRLHFCLALIHDPPMLILDEPSSGLDPISVNVVRGRIKQLNKEGKTILMTTHDLIEAEKLCDKVIIMNKGKIIAFKSPDALKKEFNAPTRIIFRTSSILKGDVEKAVVDKFSIQKIGAGIFSLTTTQPFSDIARLNEFIEANDVQVVSMKASSVSLEDIFMKMVESSEKK
ncbi:MAG: ATP-binding cassette domain-containing protein, partial [Promethearchaeota archaeon]